MSAEAKPNISATACKIVSYFGLCMKCDKKLLCAACRTVVIELEKLELQIDAKIVKNSLIFFLHFEVK